MVEEHKKGQYRVYESSRENMSPNWVAERTTERPDGGRRDVLWGDRESQEHGHSVSSGETTSWSRSRDGERHDTSDGQT
jgi:hypothetical protein